MALTNLRRRRLAAELMRHLSRQEVRLPPSVRKQHMLAIVDDVDDALEGGASDDDARIREPARSGVPQPHKTKLWAIVQRVRSGGDEDDFR